MTQLAESLSFLSEFAYKITVWVEGIVSSYRKARLVRSTMKELNALSDAELRDIGITRGEIYEIAHETHHGRSR